MTLYKNEKSALPLSDTKHKKVALIGPQGTNAGAVLWTALHRMLFKCPHLVLLLLLSSTRVAQAYSLETTPAQLMEATGASQSHKV